VGALQHPLRDQARAFVNWLRDQGYCTTNPFERPGISKGPGRKHDKPLTEDDLRALDEACAVLGAYANPMSGWLHFQAYVGCRPAEGLGVERALDIDLKAGEVHIRQQRYRDGSLSTPKNGRERTIILPDPAREKLALIPTRLGSPWLFHNKRGDELLYPPLLGYWHSILAASGLAADRRWLEPTASRREWTRTTCAISAAPTSPTWAARPRTSPSSSGTPTAARSLRSCISTPIASARGRGCTRRTGGRRRTRARASRARKAAPTRAKLTPALVCGGPGLAQPIRAGLSALGEVGPSCLSGRCARPV
jgi:hypothetical protein